MPIAACGGAIVAVSQVGCEENVWLQLQFFMSIVTATNLYGGELWGVRPRTAAQRHITNQKYSKHASAPIAAYLS